MISGHNMMSSTKTMVHCYKGIINEKFARKLFISTCRHIVYDPFNLNCSICTV